MERDNNRLLTHSFPDDVINALVVGERGREDAFLAINRVMAIRFFQVNFVLKQRLFAYAVGRIFAMIVVVSDSGGHPAVVASNRAIHFAVHTTFLLVVKALQVFGLIEGCSEVFEKYSSLHRQTREESKSRSYHSVFVIGICLWNVIHLQDLFVLELEVYVQICYIKNGFRRAQTTEGYRRLTNHGRNFNA